MGVRNGVTENLPDDAMATSLNTDDLRLRNRQLINGFALAVVLIATSVVVSYYILHKAQQTQFLIESVVVDSNDLTLEIGRSFDRTSELRTYSVVKNPNKRLLTKVRRKVLESQNAISALDEKIANKLAILAELGASENLDVIYHGKEYQIAVNLQGYLKRLQKLLADAETKPNRGVMSPVPIDATGAAAGKMLLGMDKLRDALDQELRTNGQQLSRVHSFASGLIILMLIIVTLVIVRPLIKSLNKAQTDLLAINNRLAKQAYYDNETDLMSEVGIVHTETNLTGAAVIQISNAAVVERILGLENKGSFYKEFADRLRQTFGPDCEYARIGDREFLVGFTDTQTNIDSVNWNECRREMSSGFTVHSTVVTPEIAIGITRCVDDEEHVKKEQKSCLSTLLNDARLAVMSTNASQPIATFHTEMRFIAENNNRLVEQIREGIHKREFLPFYQLKFDANTRKPVGMEALCRWKKEDGSLVSPGEFIPVAESSGLITEITWLLLEKIVEDAIGWRQQSLLPGHIAFNAATWSLQEAGFVERLTEMCLIDGVALPLEVEITENVALSDDNDGLNKVINSLRDEGFPIALDDFGTGYASLGTLIGIQFDTLKIDRSFIVDMASSDASLTIVETMVSIARTLGVNCVAEGVEEENQTRLLSEMGCDVIQGFFFHKPAIASEVTEVLLSHQDAPGLQSAA